MNPFSALLKSLQPVFELSAIRNKKYVYAPIQSLKNAVEAYKPDGQHSFITLLHAIIASKPFIEKWRIHFDEIKECMDNLAKAHQLPPINWESLLNKQKHPHRFNLHSASRQSLIPWLESKKDRSYSNKSFLELTPEHQTKLLIEHVEQSGFSEKLTAYLRKHPNFLFDLIMFSEKNFTMIAGSRLNLYLTDTQLAFSILKHGSKFLIEHPDEFVQVEKFIDKLNEILTNGRSVATLLRNEDAKTVLATSKLFQQYQSEDYKNRKQATAPSNQM